MSGKAAKIMVTEKQQAILQHIARSATSTVRHVRRARIILEGFQGKLNREISAIVGLDRVQIGLWRRRWADSSAALVAIECQETNAELTRAIQQVLSDAPRSGSPGTFTAEQVTQILAVACEPPENSSRPINRWTHRELRDEVIQRGIVSSISKSQVGSYLKQADLQPHRSKYWLNTKKKCEETFDQQVQLVCQTHLEARYVARREGIDESTFGIKGRFGILKAMSTRQAFLMDRAHRIRFVYTPKHSSWLNQIEIVFGIVHRRAVARGSFTSLDELKQRLLDFIDYFNRTIAQPLRWTYTGRPVNARPVPRPRIWRESWVRSRKDTQELAMVT